MMSLAIAYQMAGATNNRATKHKPLLTRSVMHTLSAELVLACVWLDTNIDMRSTVFIGYGRH